MGEFHIAPVSITFLLLWLSSPGHCQFDPYGGPPYYGDAQPFPQYYPPEGAASPQAWSPQQQQHQQLYPPVNANNANLINPFLAANNQGQSTTQQQQQQLQQLQGSYPNLPSLPFQTVTPNNPYQTQGAANRYPFNPNNNNNFGNLGNGNNNQNQPRVDKYPFNPNNNLGNIGTPNNNNNQRIDRYPFNPTQQQPVGSAFPYPNFPNLPFQTISPTQFPPIDRLYNPNIFNNKPKIPLPRIRVIEFPSSEYFEYGGGKLVQPKRPNADLYVGGSDADVPITSRIFVECTGPNQVEWVRNGTSQLLQRKPLSVVTKNIQITIPEERVPAPGSGEYTYLRLGLEEQIAERDSGVYICRDRILPQNYISIRVLVAKPIKGRPNYPFDPKDPNTIYFSRSDSTVTLPCKIEDAQATINLHKNEGGKLSCPYTMDGRVVYDRYKGFTMQTRAFQDIEGRYVCVGDFNGELRLMKYRLVASEEHFTTRYVGGDAQNIIALDGEKKSSADHTSASTALLAKVDSFPKSVFSGLTMANLTGSGLVDPRSEFDIATAESSGSVPPTNSKSLPSFGSTNADQNYLKL